MGYYYYYYFHSVEYLRLGVEIGVLYWVFLFSKQIPSGSGIQLTSPAPHCTAQCNDVSGFALFVRMRVRLQLL